MNPKTAVLAAATTMATMVAALPLAIGISSPPPPGGTGATSVAMAAYERAAATISAEEACEVPAWLLAAVGEIESAHGTTGGAQVAQDGSVSPPIVGPAVGLADTDGGRWDGLAGEDRAVGPMQILPSTWTGIARDGSGDGTSDPHNLFDAALAAAEYLCDAASPMATEAQWRQGLFAYNRSRAYVDAVLAAGQRYRDLVVSSPGGLVEIPGIGLTSASWAGQVRSLLDAARRDGITLTGHSYRDRAAQVLLRRAHCGTSHYAVYDMPASACRPPTARPGTSLHERGLAIDFHNCSTRSTRCFQWLQANAARYGLFNLASEPWHWSSTGG